MIKNIVLDMGNVLLDYDPEVPLREFCGSEEAKDVIRRELFEGPEWELGDLGEVTDFGRYDLVRKRVPEAYHEELRKCCSDWDICMLPVKGALEFCQQMKAKGYRLYVLSNASDKFYDYFSNFAPPEFFDGIMVSAFVHLIKPDLNIYKLFLEQFGLQADECLFIDDRENNVESAQAAGLQGHLFQNDFDQIIGLYDL